MLQEQLYWPNRWRIEGYGCERESLLDLWFIVDSISYGTYILYYVTGVPRISLIFCLTMYVCDFYSTQVDIASIICGSRRIGLQEAISVLVDADVTQISPSPNHYKYHSKTETVNSSIITHSFNR